MRNANFFCYKLEIENILFYLYSSSIVKIEYTKYFKLTLIKDKEQESETERRRGGEIERQGDGETERWKDGETESWRDGERERQRDRETKETEK